jgi:hypothetical protein
MLTYSTMFNPPEELHTRFDEALAEVKAGSGKEHGMIIDGKERFADEKFEDRSPINTDWVLGIFQKGTARMRTMPSLPPNAPSRCGAACPGKSAWPGAQSGRDHGPAHL